MQQWVRVQEGGPLVDEVEVSYRERRLGKTCTVNKNLEHFH